MKYKLECLSCSYYGLKCGCQAIKGEHNLNMLPCETSPAAKIPPKLVLTAVDISKLLDCAVEIPRLEGIDSFNLKCLVNEFGE